MVFSKEFSSFILENFKREDYSDKVYLEEFRKLLVVFNEMDFLVQDIICGDLKESDVLAIYYNKSIVFDVNKINDYVKDLKSYGIISSEFNNFLSFIIPQILIHEVSHAYQDLVTINGKDLWSKILRDSARIYSGDLRLKTCMPSVEDRLLGEKLYNMYHYLFPGEREAEMISFDFMRKLYGKAFLDDIIGIMDLESIYHNIFIQGYAFYNNGEVTCPLREFYSVSGNIDVYNTFDFSEYDVSTREIYGMPLTRKEFDSERFKILKF